MRLTKQSTGMSPESQVQQLVEGVERFAGDAPQNDDMTIVVLRRL